jgi:hypothetical protein
VRASPSVEDHDGGKAVRALLVLRGCSAARAVVHGNDRVRLQERAGVVAKDSVQFVPTDGADLLKGSSLPVQAPPVSTRRLGSAVTMHPALDKWRPGSTVYRMRHVGIGEFVGSQISPECRVRLFREKPGPTTRQLSGATQNVVQNSGRGAPGSRPVDASRASNSVERHAQIQERYRWHDSGHLLPIQEGQEKQMQFVIQLEPLIAGTLHS